MTREGRGEMLLFRLVLSASTTYNIHPLPSTLLCLLLRQNFASFDGSFLFFLSESFHSIPPLPTHGLMGHGRGFN